MGKLCFIVMFYYSHTYVFLIINTDEVLNFFFTGLCLVNYEIFEIKTIIHFFQLLQNLNLDPRELLHQNQLISQAKIYF